LKVFTHNMLQQQGSPQAITPAGDLTRVIGGEIGPNDGVVARLGTVESNVTVIQTDMQHLKNDVQEMKTGINAILQAVQQNQNRNT
jgi:hypothetical protein